jgi:hypothetical protein
VRKSRVPEGNEMTASTNLIQHSFELAAERCEDLTPLV